MRRDTSWVSPTFFLKLSPARAGTGSIRIPGMDALEGLQMFLPPVDTLLPDCVRHQAVSSHEEGDEARRPPPPGG